MTCSRVDLVLFDLDGTLVDHDSAAGAAVETWLLGTCWVDAVDVPALVMAWDHIAERHFAAYRAGQMTFKDQRRARLRDFLPRIAIDASEWADERLDSMFHGYLAAYEAAWQAFPDASPSLEAVRRVARVGVLSNGDQDQQPAKVARTGLGRHLDVVLTSDELGVAKPDPSIFTLACSRLNAQPEATMHVGDRLEVDAVAATSAGLRGVWLNRRGVPAPPGVETIRSLSQLPHLVSDCPRH